MKLNKTAVVGSVTALLVGLGLGSVALADIPDSGSGEITACRVSGEAGNVRIIDKEDDESCHPYEEEISWFSGSSEFAPKLYTDHKERKLAEFGGTTILRTYTCPAGEKLVNFSAGNRAPDSSTSQYPGGLHNTFIDSNVPIFEYVENNGIVTGAKVNHSEVQFGLHVAYICSP